MVAELEKLLQEVLGEKVLLCRRKKLRAPLRNSLGVLRRRYAMYELQKHFILSTCHTHLFTVVLIGCLSEPIQLLAVSKQPVLLLCTAVEHVSLHA